jgi:hypothetical protein
VSVDVASARRDWGDGYRRLIDASREPVEGERLHAQVDLITEELRKRVGATFTLAELAAAYGASDAWVREVVGERSPTPGWARTVSLAGDAAFHLYARGAVDYQP